MITRIKSIHEETYSDKSRILGVLYNYNLDNTYQNSFPYYYKEGMYIFFETIIDMIDYILYGEKKMKRAYLSEIDFDELYDSDLDDTFDKKIRWVN